MGDYYKRLELLGSAAEPKTAMKIGSIKPGSQSRARNVPTPKARPADGQRLKSLALEYGLNVPDDVDFDQNIARSRKFDLVPLDFYNQVKYGGEWDYKARNPKKYEDFGNYHFGAMAAAAGFRPETILRMAGWAQRWHDKGPSVTKYGNLFLAAAGVGGEAPYGDDPRDQFWIKKGIDDYAKVTNSGKYAEIPYYLRTPHY